MKITGWHIDGFGILANSVIDELPPGLTVLHGPNEAGKSTLLAFIRGVLFGYPTGNTREPKYPPLSGGSHGGRIFLQTAEGQWTIERTGRHPASVTRPDGSAGTTGDLDGLLGHATKTLFKSVFAFSLTELQELSGLDDDEVREKVFAAGITGVGTSAREAIATLDARATELLRPRSKSVLYDLATEIEALDVQLADGRRRLEAHGPLTLEETTQTEQIDALEQRLRKLLERQRRLTLLQDLWPIWDGRRHAAEQLSSLPDTSGFPVDGDSRLATAAETVRSARGALQAAADRRVRLVTERETFAGDDPLAAVARRLEAIAGEVVLHRARLEQSSAKRVEVDEAQQRLDEALLELGPGWNEERLRALDTSIPQREELRTWQARLDGTDNDLADATREAGVADEAAAAASDALEQLIRETAELGNPPSSAVLDEVDRLVAQLRAELTQLSRLEERLASARMRAEDAETLAQTDRPLAPAFDPMAIGRRLRMVTVVALLLAALLGAVGEIVAAGLVVALAVVAAAVAARLAAAHRRHEATASSGADAQSPADRAALARKAADDVAADLAQLQVATLDIAQRAGFAAIPTPAQLEIRATEGVATRRTRDLLDDCEKRLAQARQVHDIAAERAATLVDETEARNRAAATALREWGQWRTTACVDGDLAPASCLDLFEAVRRARELMSARDRFDHEREEMEERLSAWEGRARDVLDEAGRHGDAQRSALPDDIVVAHRAAQDDAQQRDRAKELDDQIAEIDAQIRVHETDREHGQSDLDAVLREAGATSPDDFAKRHGEHARRVEQTRVVEAADAALREKLGSDDPVHPVLVDVAVGDLQAWASDREAADIERQQLEQERDAAIAARSKAQLRRLDLEKSADVPSWEAERAALLTELQRAAHEWRVIQVARELITDTLATYVRDRQPAVLGVAGEHFSTVTGGRYTRLSLPSDGTTDLQVINARGSRRRLNELSRGTAEQLYLCMRMGLAAEVAERATGLPIVMDDVLVNFSPHRAAAMVEVLAEAAENGQQILFFTCHPSIRDLILERVGDARVEELEPLALG